MKKYKLNKGILIAIEGVDGAGKTTQVLRLKDHFQQLGIVVETLKEPTNGQYGIKIREIAINGRQNVTPEVEMELFLKDRIEDCQLNIKPALEQNKLVLLDRYYFSSIAYQGALGLDINYILKRNEEIAIIPDLVIIIDVAVKIGLSRITNFRNEVHNHFEKEEYLEKVHKIFSKMEAPYIQRIDGSRDEETVFNNLKNIIQDIITPYTLVIDNQYNLFEDRSKRANLVFFNN